MPSFSGLIMCWGEKWGVVGSGAGPALALVALDL